MLRQRILWGLLAGLLIVSWFFIMIEFLVDSAPALIGVGVILAIGLSLALMPSFRTKRTYKVMFLTASVVSSGFAVGLSSGLFESVILLPDSYIDLSGSEAVIHIQNNGLTDFSIKEFELGNFSFTFKDRTVSGNKWEPGEAKYFVVNYVLDSLRFCKAYGSSSLRTFSGVYGLSVDEELTPLSFLSGVSYPAVMITNRLLRHRSEVVAKQTSDEELDVKAYAVRFEHDVWMDIRFDNTGSSASYIYTLEFAGVTFLFEPPAMVLPDQRPNSVTLDFSDQQGFHWSSGMSVSNISATPTPQFNMLMTGQTYEILVKTMINKLYNTSVTV